MKTFYQFAPTAKVSEMTKVWNMEKESGCGWKSIYTPIAALIFLMVFVRSVMKKREQSSELISHLL